LLSNIKIVLVGTTHPGNIGAVARAMKNMSMNNLWLVSPKLFPSAEATSRASGADDILYRAQVCSELSEAIADCDLVMGASARCRTISWPEITPRECAEKIIVQESGRRVAIVFGRENSGLTNPELDLCHLLLRIPCNQNYSSLNLAAAVQIVCYELFVARDIKEEVDIGDKGAEPLATAAQMESFYSHLAAALVDIDFMHADKSKTIMRRLRRIYNRTHLDTKEVDILRGILTMSQGHKGKK
jgi:tRNA (cytidine32/uridine32-2'-O)-methyltransferase